MTVEARKAVNTPSRFKRMLRGVQQHRWMYILFIPAAAYFILFSYLPMFGVQLAFKDFNFRAGIWGSEWIGFYHFERLFRSNKFWEVFGNTLSISVKRTLFGFPAPIILALMINEVNNKFFKRTVQTISYLPHFLSWVIMGGIFAELLSPSRGVVNYFVTMFGGEPIHFLAEPSMFQNILVITGIWATVGWGTITYLAAITGVDSQLYEAAVVDGAGRFRCIWSITIPSILPIISIVFILGLSSVLSAGFDQTFNLYNERVYSTGDIIDTYVYRMGLVKMDYSFSTAVGLFKNVVGLVLVVGTNAIVRRFGDGDNALW